MVPFTATKLEQHFINIPKLVNSMISSFRVIAKQAFCTQYVIKSKYINMFASIFNQMVNEGYLFLNDAEFNLMGCN